MVAPQPGDSAAARALARVRAVAETADGLVRVTVEGGEISDLSIEPEAMRLTADALAEHILTAIRQASADASAQMAELLEAGPPGDRTSLDRVRAEVERMSAEVSQQLADVYQRLNRLMTDKR